MDNYVEMTFTNPVLLDIFGKRMQNRVLASVVSEQGVLRLVFGADPSTRTPKNTEQVLSLIFALCEGDPQSPFGEAYAREKTEILRETILRLSEVMDGFGRVRVVLNTTEPVPQVPGKVLKKRTVFTLEKSDKVVLNTEITNYEKN